VDEESHRRCCYVWHIGTGASIVGRHWRAQSRPVHNLKPPSGGSAVFSRICRWQERDCIVLHVRSTLFFVSQSPFRSIGLA